VIWLGRQLTHDIACTRFHFRRCREKFHLAYRSPQIPSNSPNLQSTNATPRVHLIAPEDARATTIARCSSLSGGPDRAWREAAAHQRAGRRAKNGACKLLNAELTKNSYRSHTWHGESEHSGLSLFNRQTQSCTLEKHLRQRIALNELAVSNRKVQSAAKELDVSLCRVV